MSLMSQLTSSWEGLHKGGGGQAVPTTLTQDTHPIPTPPYEPHDHGQTAVIYLIATCTVGKEMGQLYPMQGGQWVRLGGRLQSNLSCHLFQQTVMSTAVTCTRLLMTCCAVFCGAHSQLYLEGGNKRSKRRAAITRGKH